MVSTDERDTAEVDLEAILGRLDKILDTALAAQSDSSHGRTGIVNVEQFESLLLALALGPELDASYGGVYARLQGDPSQLLPTIGLALDLACSGPRERHQMLMHLSDLDKVEEAGLVDIGGASSALPLPFRVVRLGRRARRSLLDDHTLDGRLAGAAVLCRPGITIDDLPLAAEIRAVLHDQATMLANGFVRLQITGRDHSLSGTIVHAVAGTAGCAVLDVDVDALADPHAPRAARLDAEAEGALLHCQGADGLPPHWRDAVKRAATTAVSLHTPDTELLVAGFAPVDIAPPTMSLRRECWFDAAASVGVDLSAAETDLLASSYRLLATEIADAVRISSVRRSADVVPVPDVADFRTAASELAGQHLAGVARQVEVCHGWDDLVLEDDTRDQLQELCDRVRCQEQVLDRWSLRHGQSTGPGTTALFSGPSGTGKTAAAQVLASTLGYQLWKIDLASVVSRWLGETEKNLDAIFAAATGCDVVLLFDEADALFGKRSEVRDAHDRYANVEIAYLLQRMEEHDGVTVLATNLRQNLDDAFLRRLAFDVRFPFPQESQRRLIWDRVFPAAVPIDDGIDFGELAAEFPLSGGQIRNVGLAAAFLAASDRSVVSREYIDRAIHREYQKLGKEIAIGASAAGLS